MADSYHHKNKLASFFYVLTLYFAYLSQANAILISSNSSFGVDTVTRDSDTGLEWLDVPVTAGVSFNDVVTQFGVGGSYEGFRYASSTEILALFSNAGIGGPVDISSIIDLQQLVGTTESSTTRIAQRTLGWAADLDPSDTTQRYAGRLSAFIAITQPSFSSDASVFTRPVADQSVSDPLFGSWLVRNSTVPEPSTVILIALGAPLMLLSARRRRKITQ